MYSYNYGILSQLPGFTTIITILFIINVIIALTIIFLERKDPSATLAWILVLMLMPAFGVIFYFLFSQNIARKKIFRLTRNEEKLLTNSLTKQAKALSQGSFEFSNEQGRQWQDLIRLNQVYGRAYYTQDNDMDVLVDGHEMFTRLLLDIHQAQKTVNVMFFIIKNDHVGKALINALTLKAKEGVQVRLLVDALGSRQIRGKVIEEFVKAGGRFSSFFPPRFSLFKGVNLKLNYRNHRKMVVIDDQIGYIGGYNIAKEYLGQKKRFGYWRDTHIRLTVGSVQDLNARFLLDWRFASKEAVSVEDIFFRPTKPKGSAGVQIVSSGPDTPHEEIKRALMKMITSARKNIYIQTPYFVPDHPILESLKMAAQSGIDVRIMIPAQPDHIFVYWATYAYIGELLKAGCRVYIYDNGFLHSKVMVVDGEVMSVGSANFDRRSFKLNFEANAIVYDGVEAKRLESIFSGVR